MEYILMWKKNLKQFSIRQQHNKTWKQLIISQGTVFLKTTGLHLHHVVNNSIPFLTLTHFLGY